MNEPVITRYPPSPTGSLHIGNIRTLLFNFLFTRKHKGEIVMRFEDTDRERSKTEHEKVALDTLKSLGLTFDHGPFRQSERTEKYVEALETLIKKDLAYVAEESEDGSGEHVIRFRNPNIKITFTDLIRGDITIDTTDFGDFVIARSRTNPIYHLTVVVDDAEMGVTHVIRGEDHITSTPRQILLLEALGAVRPIYAHLPLIIGSDKKKLGKRHGAVTWQEFEAMGILPEAITNYLALLGWNPGDDREFFTLEELVNEFSLSKVNNSPAMFSYEKLYSINQHHMRELDTQEYLAHLLAHKDESPLAELLISDTQLATNLVTHVLKERLSSFGELWSVEWEGEYEWLIRTPILETSKIAWKETSIETAKEHIQHALTQLEALSDDDEWTPESLKESLWGYAEEKGKGEVLWPLRYSLTGKEKSPDPFTVAFLLGKDEALTRLKVALNTL